jgi:uncharacterized membrane protein
MNALRLGAAALLALLILQILWHAWWLPPLPQQFWPTLALAVLPLLPGLWTCRRDLRRGVLIGGIVSLFYFCHGISAVYSDPHAHVAGALEIVLTLLVIGASGWNARGYKRTKK